MDFKWLQNTFQAFTKQFSSYRGSLRHHDLCICNLIVLIANQIPLQKLGSLIGTQVVVSNIRLFSRVHSPRARCVKQERICQSFSYPGSNEIGRYVVINTEGKWTDQTNEINKEFFLFFYVLLADSSSPFRQISWLFCNPDILGEQSKFYFGCFPSFPAIIPHLPEMRKAIGHFWPILKPVSTHTPTPDLPGAADLHTSTSSQTSFPYWY